MGTINQGILGGFRGKVGNVVGFFWKGQAVMRSLAGSVANPQTLAQRVHRAHFGIAGSYASQFSSFIADFYNSRLRRSSVSRPATSVNMFTRSVYDIAQATDINTADTFAGWNIPADRVTIVDKFGVDPTLNPTGLAVTASTGRTLTVAWTDNSGASQYTSSMDIINVVFVPNVRDDRGLYASKYKAQISSVAQRRDASVSFVSPYAVEEVPTYDVYVFASTTDGASNAQSVFIGQVSVVA